MFEDVKVLLEKLERLYQLDPEAFDRFERRVDEYLAESIGVSEAVRESHRRA